MPGVMSKAHIDGFLDEIKHVNPGFSESKSTRLRENAAYTGPYRNKFLQMMRTLLQVQTNRAFAH